MKSKQSANKTWKVSEIIGFEVFNQSGERLGCFLMLYLPEVMMFVVKYDNEEILIPALKML